MEKKIESSQQEILRNQEIRAMQEAIFSQQEMLKLRLEQIHATQSTLLSVLLNQDRILRYQDRIMSYQDRILGNLEPIVDTQDTVFSIENGEGSLQ